jgi:TonB-linked SusC/RagA family outer membrane protein
MSVFYKKMTQRSSIGSILCRRVFALMFLLTLMSSAQAQTRVITGTVVDGAGNPLIGASVSIVNTTSGVLTDVAGRFSLPASKDATLRFSYVGMITQEITVDDKIEINVTLSEDATQLDNVVVVGYGTSRVKDLTGAATNVSMSQIPDVPGASLLDALSGQVVGLNVEMDDKGARPGAMSSVTIRQPVQFGNTPNAAFNQPLIVIDGVVQIDMEGNPDMTAFNMLDRSEVESMTLLKDASSAVYGSRASAGVILVQTKRGTAGQAKISYNGRIDYADAVSHPKYMNAYETGVFTNQLIDQAAYVNTADERLLPYKYSEEELNRMKNLNYDWLDKAWSPAVSQRHSLTVDGGSETATFFAGVSFQNQGNNLGSKQDYSKWGFRAGGNIQVAANLKLTASVSGYTDKQVKIKSQGSNGDYSRLLNMPKYIPWEWEVDGETHFVSPFQGPMGINSSTDATIQSGNNDAVANFFANDASRARTENDNNGWNSNFSLKYDVPFIKGLSLTASYAKSHANTSSAEVGDYYYLKRPQNTHQSGMHLIGDYTVWNDLNFGDPYGDPVKNIGNKPKVIYSKNHTEAEQMNLMVNYARTFGKHELSGTGVVERSETFGSKMKMQYDGVGFSYNGSSKTAGTLNAGNSENLIYESGALSYVGRIHYKYAGRYLFDFVIRSDASTKFAPENYWGTFPTGSIGWVISEEPFFKGSKLSNIFQFLKLRYSLGKTGKDNIAAWTWLTTYTLNQTSGLGFGANGGQGVNGALLDGSANRNITWDTSTKQNIGLDVNLLSNRLSLTTDFYYDKTKDMILERTFAQEPMYVGAPIPLLNYGKQDAWGWEFSARWSDSIETGSSWGPIRYGIGADFGINWRKVTLGNDAAWDYPATMNSGSSYQQTTGYRTPVYVWGFKTWKHTSGGDGMLRTQEDIDNYWAYLDANAKSAQTTPQYFDVRDPKDLKLGMIAYEDYAGSKATDKNGNNYITGPDGRISGGVDSAADYQQLAKDRNYNINSRFNLSWGSFSWSAQLSTSWGGYRSMDNNLNQTINTSAFINSSLIFLNDMYDQNTNPDGKWPSIMVSNYRENSDFWRLPTFRMYVRNMTFGYSIPKRYLSKIKVDAVQLNLTGHNLWDFYNPYPNKYRNMYDGALPNYPTLRTWTFGVNVTF